MNRLTSFSHALTPHMSSNVDASSSKIQNHQNSMMEELIDKAKIIFPHLILPTWVFSPLFIGYLFKISSFDTRLNLFLFLIYQYFFTRETKFLRYLIGNHMKTTDYFKDYKLIIEDVEGLKESKCLFLFHPHGYLATGLYLSICTNPIIQTSVLVGSRMALAVPWGGIIMKYLGVEGANPSNFEKLMLEKKNISLVPGGFEEATLTRYGKNRVFLKNRKGFIKLALKHGYTVYPIYTFGENDLFYSLTNEKIGLFLNKIKLPGTFPYSKYICLPNNDICLLTVVGKGIQLPKTNDPEQNEIDKYHDIYVKNLRDMFNKHRREGDSDLEIV